MRTARAIAWRVETVEETASTNELVAERARRGEAEGLVVRAECQSGGRGRQGRAWFSPPGGLYFSALLRPEAQTPTSLTLALGVAAAEATREATGLTVGLKWPNDLRVRGRKIGGILCEYLARPQPAVVAGLGLNLRVRAEHFPPALRASASSILLEGGRVPTAESLLHAILERIAARLSAYESDGFAAVRSDWLRLCDNLGEGVSVRVGNETVRGTNEGVDEAGRLLLGVPDGSVLRIDSGEVGSA